MKKLIVSSLLALGASFVALTASAQDLPTETVKANTATKGSTDIATGGFVKSALPASDDPTNATELALAAGGLFSSGNARTIALTSLAKLRVRREEHQLTLSAAGNFARAGKKDEPVDTTVENYQGLARYDYFFSNKVSLFLQTTARRDRFQGLDLRLNVDPGIAYYFVNTKTNKLQVEAGYDFQYDIRRDPDRVVPVPDDAPVGTQPMILDKTQDLHNLRLFVGYENKLYKEVSFVTSLEYLQNFADTDKYRLIFDIGLKTNIAEKLAIATTYTMRYENSPLPNVEKSDSIASINLVYTLF